MTGAWQQYLMVFAGSAFLCVVLTPVAMKLAHRIGAMDRPGGHKSHDFPIPYLGGVAIVVGFSGAVALSAALWPPPSGLDELIIVLSVGVALALVGLFDDLRQLAPSWRVGVEVAAAVAIWSLGSGVTVTNVEVVDFGLTVLWVVGITNAFNLLDNMDGLAAGLGAITSMTFFAVASANGQFLVAALSIGLAGCTIGFLRHNFHPARIYMGDGGALFIGFLIAYLGVKLRFERELIVSAGVPVMACSVAIFDTSLVTVSRLSNGRSPFQGGQDHLSHRLVKIGLPVPVAVAAIYFGAASIGVLAFLASTVDASAAWILVGLVGVSLVVGGAVLLTVRVYPSGVNSQMPVAEQPEDELDQQRQSRRRGRATG